MKIESQKRPGQVLFLAAENMLFHVNQPFRIRQDMIEMRNFVPEAFIIHQFHETARRGKGKPSLTLVTGDTRLPLMETEPNRWLDLLDSSNTQDRYLVKDDDEEDEDWDEDDEEWDEDDEEWDEDDEEWDEEDEDWDEDDDADDEEDWDEDEE